MRAPVYIIGGDPGSKGCITALGLTEEEPQWWCLVKGKTQGYSQMLGAFEPQYNGLYPEDEYIAYLETVHARRGDRLEVLAGMMKHAGKMELILESHCKKLVMVEPKEWQQMYGLLGIASYGERKAKAKEIAQKLWPNIKVTLDMADSMLIARYGQMKEMGL